MSPSPAALHRECIVPIAVAVLLLAVPALSAAENQQTRPSSDASQTRPSGDTAQTQPSGRMPTRPAAPGTDPAPGTDGRPRSIAFLVVDGVYNTELTAPLDVLQHVRFHSPDDWPETFLVSPDGRSVRSFEGLIISPDYSFRTAPPIDVLVVPSAEHSMDTDLENTALIEWVRETGRQATHIVSLCDGAFVLAAAGLLDGVPATTFPADQDRFGETFPQVELVRNVSFVDAGQALTSVGGAKSFDVAMWLVDRVWGRDVAEGVGGGLLIDWQPGDIPRQVKPAPSR